MDASDGHCNYRRNAGRHIRHLADHEVFSTADRHSANDHHQRSACAGRISAHTFVASARRPEAVVSDDLILYRWRVRHELNPKHIYVTRHHMTDEQAQHQYGERLVERVESSRMVPADLGTMGHAQRGPGGR